MLILVFTYTRDGSPSNVRVTPLSSWRFYVHLNVYLVHHVSSCQRLLGSVSLGSPVPPVPSKRLFLRDRTLQSFLLRNRSTSLRGRSTWTNTTLTSSNFFSKPSHTTHAYAYVYSLCTSLDWKCLYYEDSVFYQWHYETPFSTIPMCNSWILSKLDRTTKIYIIFWGSQGQKSTKRVI